eukprot:3398427-Alexandrium_andersonii.AAC.1
MRVPYFTRGLQSSAGGRGEQPQSVERPYRARCPRMCGATVEMSRRPAQQGRYWPGATCVRPTPG